MSGSPSWLIVRGVGRLTEEPRNACTSTWARTGVGRPATATRSSSAYRGTIPRSGWIGLGAGVDVLAGLIGRGAGVAQAAQIRRQPSGARRGAAELEVVVAEEAFTCDDARARAVAVQHR